MRTAQGFLALSQNLLGAFAFTDVLEVNCQPSGHGVGVHFDIPVSYRGEILKFDGALLEECATKVLLQHGPSVHRKNIPEHLAKQLLAIAPEETQRVLIDVGETPLCVQSVERIRYALE